LIYITRYINVILFFFSSRRRHTRSKRDWSSDVCSSDLDWGGVDVGIRTAWSTPAGQVSRSTAVPIHVGPLTPVTPVMHSVSSEKIGRASCREREEIGRGGGTVKIKQENGRGS